MCRVSIVDLRARKQAEAEQARVRALEEQNRLIVEANRLKSEFVVAMSHELRTPLNSIIGFAEILHDGGIAASSVEGREFLGDILASSQHLLRLINDVLDLAKVEAGKLELHPEPVVLPRVLAEVTDLLRPQARHKQIHVDYDCDPALGVVRLDPLRLKQVLYNLLSNALKFTPTGGRVVVRATTDAPSWFVLEVEDSGIGIAADQLGRLFEDFSQLGTGDSKAAGTGLGLALTRRIVQAQGGSVGVRSEPGRGSVFHARLPR